MFLVVLGSVVVMYAQNSTQKKMTLTGTVCQSSCVTRVGNSVATCDPNCTDKSGDAVLVDEQGNVLTIANQQICSSHMGKHVKMTALPTGTEDARAYQIMEVVDLY
jgi:hypothetical protein